MNRYRFVPALFVALSFWAAGFVAAPASANYPDSIPNGRIGDSGRCGVCHVSAAGGGERTSFGEDFRRGADGVAGTSDDRLWSRWLAGRDSDGDGWSNGQELGDPFANWTSGTTPPLSFQSNPGSAGSAPESGLNLCIDSRWNDCATIVGACSDSFSGSGRWGCSCQSGYAGTGHRRTSEHDWSGGVRQRYVISASAAAGCSDVDECLTAGRCGAGSCINLSGTYRCSCPGGYAAPATGGTCTDVNECATPGTCGVGTCSNTVGSYSCTCPAGYGFSGATCVVSDACTAGVHDCDPNAVCTRVGTMDWTCTCRTGWRGVGTASRGTGDRCVDINECTEMTGVCGVGTCTNTSGSYRCTCPSGYRGTPTGGSCVDIDECAELPELCDVGTCSNRAGTYTCSCPAGYRFDGTTCADLDECATSPCGAGNCVQRFPPPGYGCACQAGYRFDGTTCVDVNECIDPTLSLCSSNARCENSVGSHRCICNPGYEGDGYNCVDIVECDAGRTNECDENATCMNTEGGYSCVCNAGWEGSGVACTDVDECVLGTHGCQSTEVCVNLVGMRNRCDCAPGYERIGPSCVSSCGNAERTPGEACDDGNTSDGDGCSGRCEVEPGWACFAPEGEASMCERTCGDGLVQAPGEECDDGDANSDTAADACRTRCVRAHCGDHVIDTGETCDDGALNSDTQADACRTRCEPGSCGDGVVDSGERCDPGGGPRNPDDCVSRCDELIDAGPGGGGTSGGCGCRVGGNDRAPLALLLAGMAWLVLGRRRRTRLGGRSRPKN
jgi:MYXO-CTERM domain-containing protein